MTTVSWVFPHVFRDFAHKLSLSLISNNKTPLHTLDLSNNMIEDKGKQTRSVLPYPLTLLKFYQSPKDKHKHYWLVIYDIVSSTSSYAKYLHDIPALSLHFSLDSYNVCLPPLIMHPVYTHYNLFSKEQGLFSNLQHFYLNKRIYFFLPLKVQRCSLQCWYGTCSPSIRYAFYC